MKHWLTSGRKISAILLTMITLSISLTPILTSTQNNSPLDGDITIINVYSYPTVGDQWTVLFTTIGQGNLTISAVDGTTWSYNNSSFDLRFLEVKQGNETLNYSWIDNSIFIENYSSDEIGYETSKVLTSGRHTLMFQFGDDVEYAYNDASDWWNSSWNYRKLITINSSQVSSDLTNFPVMIYRSSDSDLANNSKCQNDGDDIIFILYSDNTTQLNHEIERFNESTGELISWVNVTSISSSVDTKIWMYYGNSTCSSQQNVSGTWDSNYLAVYHFENDSLEDSTSNGYDGSNSGTSYNSSCKIGGGRIYGGDHYIDINNFATVSTVLTAETWIYRDSDDSQQFIRLFTEGPDWNDNDWCLYWRTNNDNMRFVINGNDYQTGGTFSDSATWFHTAITYDTGDAYLYRNGTEEADWSGEYGASINNVYDTLTIGNQNNGGRPWNGKMDEVRISSIARSQAWISTTYNTTNSPDTFLIFGNEQNITNTSVDTITPYTITYTPYTITATGSNGLDNVTLWYRYSTDNSSWDDWVENTIDTSSPWEWSFGFSNSTGYYEFYSIGKKSGLPTEPAPSSADAICYFNASINTPPTIEIINPSPNGTSDIIRQPLCQIWANDSEGNNLTIYWYENTSGPWVLQQTNSNVIANSTFNWTYTQANAYGTTYWWKVAVNDSTDNTTVIYYFTTETIDTSVDTITPYIKSNLTIDVTANDGSDLDNVTLYYRWSEHNFSEWQTLTYDDFEGASFNWGNYTDGGVDCLEYTGGTYAHQGSNAVDIQDNSGVGSSFYHTSGIDVDSPGYEYIKVEFWFYAVAMETGEDFWVRYYNGSDWSTVATYVADTDFVNDQFYHETVWINETSYVFPSNMQIRFRCDASADADDIYIDEIYVNATTALGNSTSWAIWSNSSNPDADYPWNWSFNCPEGIGYYEFYSIGNKSGSPNESAPTIADARCYYNPNPAPTIELISPANGSINIELQPNCQINANDGNGDTLTVYWYEYTTGSWILRQTNSSIDANSTVNWTYNQASGNGTTYWWKVAVNDSVSNITAIYHFTTKPINTSVDTITPYNIEYTPLNISATGNSSLDNVTLYYRWSQNNFTWTTLTYDDFEGASFNWGNYTDGGVDCLEYTGGTYAHQGSNAADIQDDSGVGSSFYHTSGIDVDSPGYEYIKVEFWFYAVAMETGEDFWVRYYNGSDWSTVATYVAGTDFVNDQFYHETVWINESSYVFPSDMQIRFRCDASADADDIYIDEVYVNATTILGNYTNWDIWSDSNNPDDIYPWNWSFNFPQGPGYYEFYSIGNKTGSANETSPATADAICYYYPAIAPIINSYNLSNSTGSKLNNLTGLIEVNEEYYFTINITDSNGWEDIDYINITTWYDNGSETSTYNETLGGNLNMYLQYENTTGTANWSMLWPDNEATLILANCTETIIEENIRIINFSFIPGSQIRWANSNYSWLSTENTTDDPWSWNFNITVTDSGNQTDYKRDEYGVYRYTSVTANSDWVDVFAMPGFSDDSSIVTISYSSNYDFNMSIYFEENLTHSVWPAYTISIADNVTINADADPNDDIVSDQIFAGVGEIYAVDIFNISGLFQADGLSQTVDVQFNVFVPFGTMNGKYTAQVATKISHDE